MTRLQLFAWLLLSPFLLGLGACSSTGSSRSTAADGSAQAVVVSFRDYRSGYRFSVVNDAYLVAQGVEGENHNLRKAAFQSSAESDLFTKVTTNEAVDALLGHLDNQGFSKNATEGPAPAESASSERLTSSLEVIVGGRARTWLFDVAWSRTSSPPRELKQYATAKTDFLDFHGLIEQYASGEADDWDLESERR